MSPEQLLGELEATRRAVIADMEAGVGTLTRMPEGSLDIALLVTEPSYKAIEVVRVAAEILVARGVARRLVVVANKTRTPEDLERVTAAIRAVDTLADIEVVAIPEDGEVLDADVRGISPIDAAPTCPAVLAIAGLAQTLAA